jgi:hypothetical protein
MGSCGRWAAAPREPVRSGLAGWIRRLSARIARVAAALEPPAPNTVALDDSGAPDGPPEHWLRVVAERAPELLDGGGIRAGTAIPHVAGPLSPVPDVVRSAAPDRSPVGRPVLRLDGGQGDPGPTGGPARPRPAPRQAPVPDRSSSVDGTPVRAVAEPTHRRRPHRDPRRVEPRTREVSTVDTPEHVPTKKPLLRRVLARLTPIRVDRSRRPLMTEPVRRQRATATAEVPVVGTTIAADGPVPDTPLASAPGRTLGWPVDDRHGRPPARMPSPDAPVDPGLWGSGFGPVPAPVRWGGDRRPVGPPARDPTPPTRGNDDTRWPAPPSGGPWPWATRRPDDLWPALPDDRDLWSPPSTVFNDARIRRLDDEQRGA